MSASTARVRSPSRRCRPRPLPGADRQLPGRAGRIEKADLDLVGEAGLHAKGEDHASDRPDVTAAAAGVDRADLVHEAHDVAARQQRERLAPARDVLTVDRGDRAEQPGNLGGRARGLGIRVERKRLAAAHDTRRQQQTRPAWQARRD
jgi:hypothetical protein